MENKKNVVQVSSTNFYVLKSNPKRISYKEIKDKKNDWFNVKLNIDINEKMPNDDEIMFCYGDLWKCIVNQKYLLE